MSGNHELDGLEEPPICTFGYSGLGPFEFVGESEAEYVFQLMSKTGSFYERELLGLLDHIGIADGIVVDAGAHIGNHTVFFAKVMGLETMAFEPREENVRLLIENVRRNRVSELVEPKPMALGSKSGRARLEQKVKGNSGSFVAVADRDGPIEVNRLDDLVVDKKVSLIKVDVEGEEVAVLRGALKTLDRFRPVVSVEAHTGADLNGISDVLDPFGYAPIAVEGRSDNYVFVSRSAKSVVSHKHASRMASLYQSRRRDQILDTNLRTFSEELSSLHGRVTNQTQDMLILRSSIESLTDQLTRLPLLVDERDRQLRQWRYEYARLSRSRALRVVKTVRGFLAKAGLVHELELRTADQIESMFRPRDPEPLSEESSQSV